MKKWFIAEALVLTLPAVALMAYAIPMLVFGLIEAFIPHSTDMRSFVERITSLLPYVGGVFGLGVLWRYIFALSQGRKLRLGVVFGLAVLAGIVACRELFNIAPVHIALLICVPLWVLVVQVGFMSKAQARVKD